MSVTALQVANIVGAPLLLGVAVLRLAGVRSGDDRLAYPAWAYVIGSLVNSLFLFGWVGAGMPLRAYALVPVAIAGCLLAAGVRWRTPAPSRDGAASASLTSRACLAAAIIASVFVLGHRGVHANRKLITFGDEANIWSVKAKAMWEAGAFDDRYHELMRLPVETIDHPDYPLFNPLVYLWTYVNAGEVVNSWSRAPVQLFALALLLLLAAALSRLAHGAIAGAVLWLFASSEAMGQTISLGAADAMVALGFVGAIDAWQRAVATGERRWLAIFALFLPALAWSKNEGLMLALAVLVPVGWSWWRRRRVHGSSPLWALAPLVVVVLLQASFNRHFELTNDLFPPDKPGLVARAATQAAAHAPVIARYAYQSGFEHAEETNWILMLAFVALALAPRRTARAAPVALGALLLSAVGFTLIYLGTTREIDWHLRFSILRVELQMMPAAALVLVAAMAALLRREESR